MWKIFLIPASAYILDFVRHAWKNSGYSFFFKSQVGILSFLAFLFLLIFCNRVRTLLLLYKNTKLLIISKREISLFSSQAKYQLQTDLVLLSDFQAKAAGCAFHRFAPATLVTTYEDWMTRAVESIMHHGMVLLLFVVLFWGMLSVSINEIWKMF